MANTDEVMLAEEHRLFAEILFGEAQVITASCEAERSSPESLIEQAEIRHLIEDILGFLTRREKEIVCLRFGIGFDCDLTQAEVARHLGISGTTVAMSLNTSLRKLRGRIRWRNKLRQKKHIDFSIVVAAMAQTK